jgi:hypothetical protein
MARRARGTDAGAMPLSSPRNRIRAVPAPTGSMRYLNVLLAFAAALCVLAVAAGSLIH